MPEKIQCAVATDEEISSIVEYSKTCEIYSKEDVDKLKKGMSITLVGYPWDGLTAEVVKVDAKRKKVTVSIDMGYSMQQANVSFDNVFYSIYKGGYDENETHEKPSVQNANLKSELVIDL
jgi:hypothetical protein